MKKDLLIIPTVIILLADLIIFLMMDINISAGLMGLVNTLYETLGEFGVYLAILILSLIGNMTVIVPFPYLIPLMTILIILPVNPVILILLTGLGASVGELTSWLLGRGARQVISIEKKEKVLDKKIKGLVELIKKGFGMPLVILFAATPLPDDLILFALGMVKYSLLKALIGGFIGKTIMASSLILVTLLAKTTSLGQFILGLYGLKIVDSAVVSAESPLISNLMIIITAAILILIVIVDWEKLYNRIKKKV